MSNPPHVAVCICTYRRASLLVRLLQSLAGQQTEGRLTFSIVVADNDAARSAEPVVTAFARRSAIPVHYTVEATQNIALARNRAVAEARGDLLAFIDDDEFAPPRWLLTLLDAYDRYRVDGILGPVKPHFDERPPRWIVKGGFYDRASYPTGTVIDWIKGRTGNTLLNMRLFSDGVPPFRPEFPTGEDQDFFERMIDKGHVFVWCAEAVAYEVVPPTRWNRMFILRRALLRGATSLAHPTVGARHIGKSLIAVPVYAAALPVAMVLGQHHFMKLMVKLCDHGGRLLAAVGIRPVTQPYVTE